MTIKPDAIDMLMAAGRFTAEQKPQRANWQGRALSLFFRLNADMLNYVPLSQKARRASRIIPALVEAMEQRA